MTGQFIKVKRYLYLKLALYKHLLEPTRLHVLQIFCGSNGSPAGTRSCQTSLSPRDSLFKSFSLSCPNHVLPESCLGAISLIRSLSVTPKKQHTKITVQLSKTVLVLPALTKEASMAYVRGEKSSSETTLELMAQ